MSQASQISQISQLCQGRSWSGVTNFTKSGSQWHCQCVKSGLSQAFQISQTPQISQTSQISQISQTSQISQLRQCVPPDREASTSNPDCLEYPRHPKYIRYLTMTPDWVASTSNPNCLKHPGIAQLSATQLSSEQLNIWSTQHFIQDCIQHCIQHSKLHSRGKCNLNDADQWLLQFVGLDAADEEGIAFSESFHQQVRRLLELWRQGHLGGEQFCRNVTSVRKICNFVKKCDKCWKS